MAGTIMHLVIADRLLDILSIKNPSLFYCGNLAPDAIMARENYEREMKRHTHFKDGMRLHVFHKAENFQVYQVRLKSFYEKYVNIDISQYIEMSKDNSQKDNLQKDNLQKDNLQKGNLQKDNLQKDNLQKDNLQKDYLQKDYLQKDNLQSDNTQAGTTQVDIELKAKLSGYESQKELYLGYVTHMLVDELYILEFRDKFVKKLIAEGKAPDDDSFFARFGKDVDQVDFELVRTHKFKYKMPDILYEQKDYEIEGFITNKELMDSRAFIIHKNFETEHASMVLSVMDYQDNLDFIELCVKKIPEIMVSRFNM